MMDRFKPPTAADDIATCVCCGERFHYEKLSDIGECPTCAEYFEDESMTQVTCKQCGATNNTSDMGYCWKCKSPLDSSEQAAELIAQSAVRVAEKLKKENAALKSQVAALREALEDCERALRFNPIYSGKDGAVTKAQAALALNQSE